MRLGKSIPIQHQAYHHLFAVRTLIAGVSALGLGIGFGLALKIGGSQVVQKNAVLDIEEGLFSFRQFALDGFSVGMQAVQIAVERRVLNRFWGATIVFLDQVSKEPVV